MRRWNTKNTNPLLKSGLYYGVVGTVKSITTMVIGILILRWLTPRELGLWNTVYIFTAYTPFFQLGIQSALNMDLPILLGGDDKDKAKAIVENSKGFAYIIFILFIITGVILTTTFYFLGKDLELILGIATISIMAAFQSIQIHLIATFRSAKAFDKLTLLYLINTFIIIVSVYFIYQYRYYGVLIYNIINVIALTTLMFFWAPYKSIKPTLQLKQLINLSKTGIVLMSFIQLRELAKSIPKWIILYMGGIVKFGLFSPALAIYGLMGMLPSQIAQFFHPQMGFKYGQTGNARDMWRYIKKMVILFPLISIPFCLGIWIITPWLLTSFFPEYIESEWPMKIMSVAFIFSSAFTTHGVLYTIKAYRFAYFYSIIEIIGYIVFPITLVKTLPYDVVTSITIGIAVNNFILYLINIYILKKVLFLPEYNKIL